VLFFDLDGTVLNWQGTVSEELRRLGNKHFPEIRDSKGFAHRQTPRSLTCRQEVDWEGFAMRWRDSYLAAMCVPSCEIGCVTDTVYFRRSLAEHGDSLSPSSVYRTVSSRNVFDLVGA
jgi:hypothetical protein